MKKKTQITDASTIESTRMMLNFGNDPIPVIRSIARTHVLTDEFISEFREYIDEKVFSTSFKLTKEMADRHPELFRGEYFRAFYIDGEDLFINTETESNTTTPIQLPNAQSFQNNISSTSGYLNLVSGGLGSFNNSDKEIEIPWNSNAKDVHISMLNEFLSDVQANEFSKDDGKEGVIEFITDVLRTTKKEELDAESVLPLMGIDNSIDQLLLKRITDEETRRSILLTLSLSDDTNTNITSASYKYMDNSMKEHVIGTENIDIHDFVKVLAESKDLGWQAEMIHKVVSGEITIEKTNKTIDNDMVQLAANISESMFVELTKIYDTCPNIFSYKIMSWVLINKYFNEDQLIQMFDILKRTGCFFQLKKIAKDNEYEELQKLF